MILVPVGLHALADIVQEGAAFGDFPVEPDLGGQEARDDCDFLGVKKDILSVTRAEIKPSQGADEFRRHVVQTQVEDDLLALVVDFLGDLPRNLLDHFLDAGRVNPSVGDETLQGNAGDFPAYRIEAGYDHGFGSIVDDDIDAGKGFQGTDIPPLPADNASLHLVRRQADRCYRRFGGHVGGDALHGRDQDIPGAFFGGQLGFLIDLVDQDLGVVLGLVFQGLDDKPLRLVGAQAGYPLQFLTISLFLTQQVGFPVLQTFFFRL